MTTRSHGKPLPWSWKWKWHGRGNLQSFWFEVRLGIIQICGQRNECRFSSGHPNGCLWISWIPLTCYAAQPIPTWTVVSGRR